MGILTNYVGTADGDVLRKLLPWLTTFVQFMYVSVSNVTVVVQLDAGVLLHTTVCNISLDGSIMPRQLIAVSVSVDALSSRLLQMLVNQKTR